MIKIFLDTEFTALTQSAQLISLALVAETGEEFYAEFKDVDKEGLNDWLQENVIKHLFLERSKTKDLKNFEVFGNAKEVAKAIEKWLVQFGEAANSIQIWADCYAWDWVLFCELWGGSFERPKQIHYMPMDLATYLYARNLNPDTVREKLLNNYKDPSNLKKHNALYDARLECDIYKGLSNDRKFIR